MGTFLCEKEGKEDSIFEIIENIDIYFSKILPARSTNLLNNSKKPPSILQYAKAYLARLELSKFDWGFMNWRELWDQLKVAINETETNAEIDKFAYLESFWEIQPCRKNLGCQELSEIIKSHINVSEQHSGNMQVLISSCVTKFVLLPKIKSSSM